MLFCCLWHNIETSCHKHFAVLSRHQQPPPLILTAKSHNLQHGGATASYWQHLAGTRVKSTHWSQISRLLPTPPAFDAPIRGGGFPFDIAMPFGTEKLEWCGYPTVKKFDAMFIRFDRTHESDRQTDRQTPHEDIGRTCIASRGKN